MTDSSRRRHVLVLVLGALSQLDGRALGAQEAGARGSAWTSVEVHTAHDGLTDGFAAWQEHGVRVARRSSARGGVGVSAQWVSRFGYHDSRLLADGSVALGSRITAGWAGEASATHRVVARTAGSGWMHVALGAGWGGQLTVTQRHFPSVTVSSASASLERYWGPWLGSWSFTAARTSDGAGTGGGGGGGGGAHAARLTRYLGARASVTASASGGREAESLGGGAVRVMDVRGVSVWGEAPLARRIALLFGAGATRQGELYVRRSLSLGMRTRFD